MLISEILYEDYGATVSRAISVDEFKQLLPQLSLAIKQTEAGNRIYRGIPSDTPIVYVDPSKAERVSANTSNEYNILFSHILPSWQKFPKRNRSLICSGNYGRANSYSGGNKAYIVMPLGNPLIAICPHEDFWDSFDISPPDFNDLFRDFYKAFRIVFDELKLPVKLATIEDIVRFLKLIDKVLIEEPKQLAKVVDDFESGFWGKDRRKTVLNLLTSGDSINALDKFFEPTKNSFGLWSYNEYLSVPNEVWFSGPAVLIKQEAFDKFFN